MRRRAEEQTLLLELSLGMMFSDGAADRSEVAVLQQIASGTPYFAAIDAEALIRNSVHRTDELQRLLSERKVEIVGYAAHPSHRRRLFEVLLIVLQADGRVASAELAFLRSVMQVISMSEAELVQMLPNAASVLFGADSFEALSQEADKPEGHVFGRLKGAD